MDANIPFFPKDWSPDVLRMILARAEADKVSPSEALRRILNEMAATVEEKEAA